MRPTTKQAKSIVAKLSTEDKVRLVSGRDFWTTEDHSDHGAPAMTMTDGPHGLRRQPDDTDNAGIGRSIPATCFPTAVTMASTWDPALIERVGAAVGAEARDQNVGVVLGPGLNIKRHPAGGRNFEYMSEDPFLAGKMAAASVRGIQSQGVGACLKHYAVNNQETQRMVVDAIVDERTLREIYLTGFEIAVKESHPWTVMSAYNRINGDHVGESRRMLTTILRDEWGFDGTVMTDWSATYDRPVGLAAGLDLEMPGSAGSWDSAIHAALDQGTISPSHLDSAAQNVVDMMLRAATHEGGPAKVTADYSAHHQLARTVASAGTVLLTNDGTLPLKPTGTIAVIGEFAATPRYQGGGSSLVNPTQVDTALDAIREAAGTKAEVTFAPGYDVKTGTTDDAMVAQAVALATAADTVVLFVGLPPLMESEGYDRDHLRLPDGHDRLIAEVTAANPRTTVVLFNGSPVLMPWVDAPAAILECYLGGQAGGGAVADVLFGAAEPGGRLAETFPASMEEVPASANFPGHPRQVEYREGLSVGYRAYAGTGMAPLFPFGHGLSYTTFEYRDLAVALAGDDAVVTLTVTNTGTRAGSEVVQVYVRDLESSVPRPDRELKGFAKVHLKKGESTQVSITLSHRAFAFWDTAAEDWVVESGDFEILVGSSSEDIKVRDTVSIRSPHQVMAVKALAGAVANDAEFAAMLGRDIPTPERSLPFHRDSTVADLRQTWAGRYMRRQVLKRAKEAFAGEVAEEMLAMVEAIIAHMPLRGLAMSSEGAVSFKRLDTLIRMLNATSIKVWFSPRR